MTVEATLWTVTANRLDRILKKTEIRQLTIDKNGEKIIRSTSHNRTNLLSSDSRRVTHKGDKIRKPL